MVMGIDPAKMAEMQKVSQFIKGAIRVNYKEQYVKVELTSEDTDAQALIPQLLEQFSSALAVQLSSFFAIQGEIIETGKD